MFEGNDYNLKKSLSNLSGQDVKSYNNDLSAIIQGVRDWLNDKTPKRKGGLAFPHAPYLKTQFDNFKNDIPALYTKLNWSESNLTYADYLYLASPWITATIISTQPRHP